ncbi:hypothetical protein [Evansella clarkii]|uniref:hypothetical protein n=1 Tax=Evansella clarkii TaxID=79879 RepID=UPI0009967329|nr:hypothetical protein [Evansella clarkii]
MVLLNGVSGSNGPDSRSDGLLFQKICYLAAAEAQGRVLSFHETEVARNYYKAEVELSGKSVYNLLNSTYPFVAFAEFVDLTKLVFIDNDWLSRKFKPYFQVLSSAELHEPIRTREGKGKIILLNNNELNDAELNMLEYYRSVTSIVGDIVFNFWD